MSIIADAEALSDLDFEDEPKSIYVRGLDPLPPMPFAGIDRMPTHVELMALPPDARVDAIWESGVRAQTDEMREVFRSIEVSGLREWAIVNAAETGLPANGRFCRGSWLHDTAIWGDDPPATRRNKKRKKKGAAPTARRPTRAEQDALRRKIEHVFSLFRVLRCGCLEQCTGHEGDAETRRTGLSLAEQRAQFVDLFVQATLGTSHKPRSPPASAPSLRGKPPP